ncbi:MAG: hypothetical protein ACUVQU_07665 [Candidatus Bipolaricaulia bacterium]
MTMRARWIYLLLGLMIIAGGAIGGVLLWRPWQQQGSSSTPPRYNIVVEQPLQAEGVSAKAVLVVMHLLSGVEGLAAARHYLSSRAPEADLYQFLTGESKLLALNSKTFFNKGPDQLPPELRARLVPWERAKRVARQGPYTIYRLED